MTALLNLSKLNVEQIEAALDNGGYTDECFDAVLFERSLPARTSRTEIVPLQFVYTCTYRDGDVSHTATVYVFVDIDGQIVAEY